MPHPPPQALRDSLNTVMYKTPHLITSVSPRYMLIIVMIPDPVYMTRWYKRGPIQLWMKKISSKFSLMYFQTFTKKI
jgi:hypothetical protein